MHPQDYERPKFRSGLPANVDKQEFIAPESDPHRQTESSISGVGPPSLNPREFGLVRAAYSVNETLSVLSIGRTLLYRLVSQGLLKPAKLGKKTLFYASDIAGLLNKLRELA
jgi:predicted DNA-binding transcriptional regulator AlpA